MLADPKTFGFVATAEHIMERIDEQFSFSRRTTALDGVQGETFCAPHELLLKRT